MELIPVTQAELTPLEEDVMSDPSYSIEKDLLDRALDSYFEGYIYPISEIEREIVLTHLASMERVD